MKMCKNGSERYAVAKGGRLLCSFREVNKSMHKYILSRLVCDFNCDWMGGRCIMQDTEINRERLIGLKFMIDDL